MKLYKGIVVQRCYIPVTVVVDDNTSYEDAKYQMLISADTWKGEWDSEVYDIQKVRDVYPIGAYVRIRWVDSNEVMERYFSFGQYKDDADTDEYGIPDTDIFFYAFEGESQLERMLASPENDFRILDWSLRYEP